MLCDYHTLLTMDIVFTTNYVQKYANPAWRKYLHCVGVGRWYYMVLVNKKSLNIHYIISYIRDLRICMYFLWRCFFFQDPCQLVRLNSARKDTLFIPLAPLVFMHKFEDMILLRLHLGIMAMALTTYGVPVVVKWETIKRHDILFKGKDPRRWVSLVLFIRDQQQTRPCHLPLQSTVNT